MELENVVDINVKLEETNSIGVKIQESGPPGEKGEPGKDGLSAYEIYLEAGGTLSEVEWLESLKGAPGQDGYTPVKGTDYWTVEEQNEIKTVLENYIDNQLGVIENGSY